MRITRSQSVFAAVTLFAGSAALAAQDPPPAPATTPPAATPEPAAPDARRDGERERRPRRQPIVLEAGTVHPVSGPAIADGVVVVRGERIVAIGKRGDVEIPANATVHSFPHGHLYPGFVDASTDAFTDQSLRTDGSSDGGALFADDLRLQHDRGDELVQAGVTTAYVTVRSPALVRGQGAIVRPRQHGFELWRGKEHAALQLRMTEGPVPSHPLQRQQQLQAADALFEGLDEFRKARTDHEEALKKYEKDFADYLAFHQKKKDDKKPDGAPAPAGAQPRPATGERQGPPREGRPRGNRGGGGGGGGGGEPPKDPPRAGDGPDAAAGDGASDGPSGSDVERALATLLDALAQDPPQQDPPAQDPPKPAGTPASQPPQNPADEKDDKKDEAPKRPTWPKPPPPDPQREALLQVVDGELPLRVEAHRADELRAAVRLQREREIPVLVLEQAHGAASVADQLAERGIAVVLTDVLPVPFEPPYDAFEPATLPAKLHAAGVSFAIASGRDAYSPLLPLLAAAAVGGGLPREHALRAITLTPAEILGVANETGSLQPGKLADVVVTDRPLFQSDSRILMVLAKGRTEYEAK